jgi:hypothetical protein
VTTEAVRKGWGRTLDGSTDHKQPSKACVAHEVLIQSPLPSNTKSHPPITMANELPQSRTRRIKGFLSDPVIAAFCAGGVAGAVSRTVVSPLERLKILFQVQDVHHNAYKLSVGKALRKMWQEEGWRGFMRGNGTNCVRIVPYSAVQFSSFNFYQKVSPLARSRQVHVGWHKPYALLCELVFK